MALEDDLAHLSGLDRYESIGWRLATNDVGQRGLVITAHPKPYAPPFMMLGLNLENTTSRDFRVTATARYLAYGVLTTGSELRIDGTLGSDPAAGIQLYEPIGGSAVFATAAASLTTDTATSTAGDRVLARYDITTWRAGVDAGVNLGVRSDVRIGAYTGHVAAVVGIGDTRLPELRGAESGLRAVWRFDGQDGPVVPSRGLAARVEVLHVLDGPDGVLGETTVPIDAEVTQLSVSANQYWSVGEHNRVFVSASLGASFDGAPLPTNQYTLGGAFRLGAYRTGELRGRHYYVGSAGYLRQIGRLPDFLGGGVFAGAWLDNGDAFDDWRAATWRSNASVGVILDTLVGPAIVAGSAGFDGRWRTYVGVGRIFR
jgi:NTE family protein